MNKKDSFILLVPSVVALATAICILVVAAQLFGANHDQFEGLGLVTLDKFVEKVKKGEVQITQDGVIELLNGSRHVAERRGDLLNATGRSLRYLGWGSLTGVLLQVYVVVRITRRKESKQLS